MHLILANCLVRKTPPFTIALLIHPAPTRPTFATPVGVESSNPSQEDSHDYLMTFTSMKLTLETLSTN